MKLATRNTTYFVAPSIVTSRVPIERLWDLPHQSSSSPSSSSSPHSTQSLSTAANLVLGCTTPSSTHSTRVTVCPQSTTQADWRPAPKVERMDSWGGGGGRR